MQAGNVGSRISEDLPPGRAKLAEELRKLYRYMGAVTLREAVQLISEQGRGYEKHSSELSRYLSGERLPAPGFIECFFSAAVVAPKKGEAPLKKGEAPLSIDELLDLRGKAEPHRRCRGCADLGSSVARLTQKNQALVTQLAGLERSLAQAGRRAAPLPVPAQREDRQRSAVSSTAVQHLAERAVALKAHPGPTAAYSMLREVSEVLSPLEKAASVTLFRELKHDDFADTLVQIFGRHTEQSVIRVAAQLHDHGRADDAAAVLRVAAR